MVLGVSYTFPIGPTIPAIAYIADRRAIILILSMFFGLNCRRRNPTAVY
jgi:hypothetical protein